MEKFLDAITRFLWKQPLWRLAAWAAPIFVLCFAYEHWVARKKSIIVFWVAAVPAEVFYASGAAICFVGIVVDVFRRRSRRPRSLENGGDVQTAE